MGLRIVSGGQTGVDRAALDSALSHGIGCGGWCPRGRRAEDGVIPDRYPLRETPGGRYIERTRYNVRDSDATLILTRGRPTGGTAATIGFARRAGKPFLIIDMIGADTDHAVAEIRHWMTEKSVRVLNVAGPRESADGEIYAAARGILDKLFAAEGNPVTD